MTLAEAEARLGPNGLGIIDLTAHADHLCTLAERHPVAACPFVPCGLFFSATEVQACNTDRDLMAVMVRHLNEEAPNDPG